jgi:hypothetical protein
MRYLLLGIVLRALFALTTRDQASTQIQKLCDRYLVLATMIDAESGTLAVRVSGLLPGIDKDMRNWSFFKVLEHNTIVNRSFTSIIQSLVQNEELRGAGAIDMKKDVMPSESPGAEQIEFFHNSVAEHIQAVSDFQNLRDSPTRPHPLFGAFTAHQWHCMFGFHLFIHYIQAKYIVNKITRK